MKLAFYDDFNLGVIRDDFIVDVSPAISDLVSSSPQGKLEAIITGWEIYGDRIADASQSNSGVALASLKLQQPVPRPGQLLCLAGNYIEPDHPSKETFNAFLNTRLEYLLLMDFLLHIPYDITNALKKNYNFLS